ncbi:putative porin [Acinetobacter wuhouensis]|uniref:putative porin n=1 Tax=Acinetobacter wuhouensis TaxID=1879050 RepID=UPI00083AE0CF|nr:putative porin [Acinetobacter wuhouensis]AXQ23873.1 putative porin [Acinetobacter wuhouensis]
MKRSLLAIAIATLASSSFAYNVQLDGGFSYFDHDNDFIDTDNQFDIKGTYYFNPVQSKTGPLNEAAFLGHNSNVYAKYTYNYMESKDYIDDFGNSYALAKDEREIHHVVGGLEYFYEQFYANAEVGFGRLKDESEYRFANAKTTVKDDYDVTTYRALVGFTPISNLLLAAGVDGYYGENDGDDDAAFAVTAKYVAPVGPSGQYVNLEANGTFGDTDHYEIGADYYLNKTFSIGTAYERQDEKDTDAVDYFTLRTKYFINDVAAVGAAIGFGDDVQAYNINATFRF